MPILEILDANGRFRNDAGMIVVATMLHPIDPEQRQVCIAGGIQHAYLQAMRAIPPDIAGPVFKHGGEQGITKASVSGALDGHIAGETLLYLRQLAVHTPKDATMRKARHLLECCRKKVKYTDRQTVPASRSAIEAAWGKAKTVAHLWAALSLYHQDENLSLNQNLPILLAAARWFAEFAIQHHPPGMGSNSRPVLDPMEIWRVPFTSAIEQHAFEVPPLTATEIGHLAEYKHRGTHRKEDRP